MKQSHTWIGILLLVLVMLACNGTAVQTVEVTRVVPQTVVVTDTASTTSALIGGFTTGTPVDVSSLPALMAVPEGAEPGPCFVDSAEPSISWGYDVFPSRVLCLNNFPTAPDSPGFTIELKDPTGHTFQESFTYHEAKILSSTGIESGWVQQAQGDDTPFGPATPGVSISIHTPAIFPCGEWLVSANTQDDRIHVGPTPLTVECSAPLTSVLHNLEINPFVPRNYAWEGPDFADNETLYIVGSAYPPNTVLTVALYQVDPSAKASDTGFPLGAAKYAVSITTDSSGNFQAPFVVSRATLRGPYYVVAGQAITPDIRLRGMGTRFSIK